MKISIVTPSFNQGPFIGDAIKSVLNQHFDDFEHIIIDGGSTDGTVEVLKSYPHLKWVSEPDEGQSDALNKGFLRATGDVIGWLNADDTYRPGTFREVAGQLADDRLDGVYGNLFFCDKELNILKRKVSYMPIAPIALFRSYIPSETLFFKRRMLDRGVRVDEKLDITMDKDFVFSLLKHKGRMRYVNQDWANFRLHETNKSNESKRVRSITAAEGIRIINKHFRMSLPVNRYTMGSYRAMQHAMAYPGWLLKAYNRMSMPR